jgi:hypothetical protein
MEHDRLARLTMDALQFAILQDADRAAEAIDEIGLSGDPFDMYAACCGFAETAKRAMVKVLGDKPNLAAGDMWMVQELKPGGMDADPAKTFAVRFLIAYANDDKDMAPVLYRAALEAGPEQFADSVCALLGDAADLHRLSLKSDNT